MDSHEEPQLFYVQNQSSGSDALPMAFQKVMSEGNKDTFSCQLPGRAADRKKLKIFPNQIWSNKYQSVDIFVIKGNSKKGKLCSLSTTNKEYQWCRYKCNRNQFKMVCSDKISLEAVATVLLTKTADGNSILKSEDVHTPAITSLPYEQGSPDMREMNENTPLLEVDLNMTPKAPQIPKKRARDGDITPNPKSRKFRLAMRALSTNSTPPSKATIEEAQRDSPPRTMPECFTLKASNGGKPARCVDLSSRIPKPSNRWGHTMCHINNELAVLIGGQGEKSLSKDSIWLLHPEVRAWKCPEVVTEGIRPEYRIGHSATYDPTMRCIYVYGGSKNAKWFHDVHMFDLDEYKWSLVKAEGKAPTRAYHSSTLHRHELWVFGGIFPRPDPQPDGCDNEIHIFSPIMQSWYKPIVMGDKPRSRSGHSATLINDMLVVFGGWDFPFCYNDLFVLDLTTVEWSEPKCFGKHPKPRSWHASCTLSDNRIFIHGGYDGDNALHDAHIFDYFSKTWQELILENAPSARAGHTCLRVYSDYDNQEEDEIIVFGGGDNDGTYFSDMLSFYVPHDPKFKEVTE